MSGEEPDPAFTNQNKDKKEIESWLSSITSHLPKDAPVHWHPTDPLNPYETTKRIKPSSPQATVPTDPPNVYNTTTRVEPSLPRPTVPTIWSVPRGPSRDDFDDRNVWLMPPRILPGNRLFALLASIPVLPPRDFSEDELSKGPATSLRIPPINPMPSKDSLRPVNSSLRYMPANLRFSATGLVVISVVIVAHEYQVVNSILGNTPTNFWTIELQTTKNSWFQIACIPTNHQTKRRIPGWRTKVFITEMQSARLAGATQAVHLPTLPGMKLADYVNVIKVNGFDKYEYNINGVGSRAWVWQVITVYLSWTHDPRAFELREVLRKVWDEGSVLAPLQSAMEPGRYYFA
ncbi:MAG: hypothetical protein M1827_005271 [Pycnora praestabilis]|nr:MAG: hypothetical protein M1827_005271 [Pycnora praestabilis]